MEDIPDYAQMMRRGGTPVPKFHGNIDVVLTDMCISGGNIPVYSLGESLSPSGIMVALRAASVGIKRVGLMSHANHHSDAMTCGIDMLSGTWPTTDRPLVINGSKVVITTARMTPGNTSVKNWGWLLCGLLAD